MYDTKEKVQRRIEEHHKILKDSISDGYAFGTFLQGSQNYGSKIIDWQSDIDSKSIIVPGFKSFCLGKEKVSRTKILENEEHIDIKDIRNYLHLFKKMNINIIEILFTDYYVVEDFYKEDFEELLTFRERIARYDEGRFAKALTGMCYEKRKALTHPYPSIKHKIDKYGFDGKQLSHIIRLYHFLKNYIDDKPFAICLTDNDGEYLRKVKRNEIYSLDEAVLLADEYLNKIVDLRDSFKPRPVDEELEELIDNFLVTVFRKTFQKEDFK